MGKNLDHAPNHEWTEQEIKNRKPFENDIDIKNKKPEESRYEVPDEKISGLYLIVQPSGVKSFALRYRLNGKPAKFTLGRYLPPEHRKKKAKASADPQVGDDLMLADAHLLAIDIKHQVKRGIDPARAKRERKDEQQRKDANTFASVAMAYLADQCGMEIDSDGEPLFDRAQKRTGRERYYMLRRLVLPTLGNRPIAGIGKGDIEDLLDQIAKGKKGKLKNADGQPIRGGKTAADRTLALIRTILNWRARKSKNDDYRAPMLGGLMRVEPSEAVRSRVLSDPELRVIWKTASETETPFNAFVKFLLLTAARRSEASAITRNEVTEITYNKVDRERRKSEEVTATVWTLPKERNKSKQDLARPLSEAALAVLAALPKVEGCPFYFTTDGKHPISAYSKFKLKFDAAVLKTLREQDPKAGPLPPFRLHDLRRTSRSLLSRAGISPDHAERALGHVLGGIRSVYDKHAYLQEKHEAFDELAALIQRIVSPNVVQLQFPRAAGDSD